MGQWTERTEPQSYEEADAALDVLYESKTFAERLSEEFIGVPLAHGELRIASDALLGSARPLLRVEVGLLSPSQAHQLLQLLTAVLNNRWPRPPVAIPGIDPAMAIVLQRPTARRRPPAST